MAKAIEHEQARKALEEARTILRGYGVREELLPCLERSKRLIVSETDEETRLWVVSLIENDRLWVFFRVSETGEYFSVRKISFRDKSEELSLELLFREKGNPERLSIWINRQKEGLGIIGSLFLQTLLHTGHPKVEAQSFWIDVWFAPGDLMIATGSDYPSFLRQFL
ncbi:hypothetical protein KKF11_02495 [Patescibacteria group bacterium]|nr:hypothetical protein [Patescibacteria group bacterium]